MPLVLRLLSAVSTELHERAVLWLAAALLLVMLATLAWRGDEGGERGAFDQEAGILGTQARVLGQQRIVVDGGGQGRWTHGTFLQRDGAADRPLGLVLISIRAERAGNNGLDGWKRPPDRGRPFTMVGGCSRARSLGSG